MRITVSFFGFLVIAFGLQAQQTISVTPKTLAGWTVIAADPQALIEQPVLSLPAGAQLARSFPVTGLDLTVVTKPVVGHSAEDWPVLEIGNAALLFTRSESAGKLVLVLGKSAPVQLPFTFSLDSAGRSIAPLSVSFSREADVVIIGMEDQFLQFSIGPSSDPTLEFVASAGINQAWAIDALEVTVRDAGAAANPGRQSPISSSSNATASNSPALGRQTTPGLRTGALANSSRLAGSVSAPVIAGASSTNGRLEIFTPPAVRHGRAAAIRAAVQSTSNQAEILP